jgi:hypothetical protein
LGGGSKAEDERRKGKQKRPASTNRFRATGEQAQLQNSEFEAAFKIFASRLALGY